MKKLANGGKKKDLNCCVRKNVEQKKGGGPRKKGGKKVRKEVPCVRWGFDFDKRKPRILNLTRLRINSSLEKKKRLRRTSRSEVFSSPQCGGRRKPAFLHPTTPQEKGEQLFTGWEKTKQKFQRGEFFAIGFAGGEKIFNGEVMARVRQENREKGRLAAGAGDQMKDWGKDDEGTKKGSNKKSCGKRDSIKSNKGRPGGTLLGRV